jgi:DNA polymerase (family 10)
VHSAFGQTREVMTERVLSAMRHPLVTALSHPTGRLLERRDPHAVDLQAVLDVAIETGTWIEINGGPERLDLPDIWVRKAVEKGVTLVANSDAHATEELDWMEFAVANARRGWAPRAALANASAPGEMLERRKRRS